MGTVHTAKPLLTQHSIDLLKQPPGNRPLYILRYKRKKTIVQLELTGITGEERRVIFHMDVPAERRAGLRAISPKSPKKQRGRPKKGGSKKKQLTLWDFVTLRKAQVPRLDYLLRFTRHVVAPTDYGRERFSLLDCIFYWELPGFEGYFDDLFFPEIFAFWDRWETDLAKRGLLRSIPCLRDMFVYELLRVNMGLETYAQVYRVLGALGPLAAISLLAEPTFVPAEQDFSDFYRVTPLDAFQELFWDLVERLYAAKAICCRVMIWDCQFVHSNASDYKKRTTGAYSDRDAGVGRHENKFLGVGYMVSTLYLYCGDVVAPVFCVLFPANTSDKKIFAETMRYYYSEGWPVPLVILCDRGAYSIKNLRLVTSYGTITLINVPKTVKKQRVAILDGDHRANRNFLPAGWSDADVLRLENLRTEIERRFSPNNLVYHAERLNVREIAEAAKHRYMLLILEMLKCLACVNLGRGDLLQHPTAFTRLRGTMTIIEIIQLLGKAGYSPLVPITPQNPPLDKLWMIIQQGTRYFKESEKSSKQ